MKLYSNDCPKCKILEAKMNEKGVKYEKISDIEEIKKTGFSSVPLLQNDDKILNFMEAVNLINNM